MASITIRQLDEDLKKQLRLRAARNGRSMEDEVRTILRAATGGDGSPSPAIAFGAPSKPTGRLAKPHPSSAAGRVLLIIGGGIAAYKSLDLIRRLKERGLEVRCILTAAAQRFITPLSAGALSGNAVITDLFDAAREAEIGHIRLAREADLIVVAPATADLIARMAGGHADDLATAVVLASGGPILLAPAMNPTMWMRKATSRNVAQLVADGARFVGPAEGEMAEAGEAGVGRMAEPLEIAGAAESLIKGGTRPLVTRGTGPLAGKRIVITSGPTHEPIDPVRYLANRSSGKQGHAIAAAALDAGADVMLVSGPVNVPDPVGVTAIKVETAQEMLDAVELALPADCAIFAAAVADWRIAAPSREKMKKQNGKAPSLMLAENPDILATVSRSRRKRPRLVIGFAAETQNVIANARAKLEAKGCDWIVANDVSPETGIMGGDRNAVHLITRSGIESWPPQSKDEVARALIARIGSTLDGGC
ncbi:MAG TPA: bifunctional phosphopantothenoylcysteine decarboxylase/phosphopantothenate--cysteine ligase CoaBC [Xanthobacteraceae bacterium]|jgi:phosphopantothenoylcysteine decarboxylase/phosphopantothenate--cysteine ligase